MLYICSVAQVSQLALIKDPHLWTRIAVNFRLHSRSRQECIATNMDFSFETKLHTNKREYI